MALAPVALRLDIGCGGRGSRQEGFIGIDIHPRPIGKRDDKYYRLDFVNEAYPWDNNTVDEIIALDMIEHLMPIDAEKLIRRAYDLLKSNATLTVTTCDLRLLCQKYLEADKEFMSQKHLRGGKEIWPGHTLADRLNHAIHQATHIWAYDQNSILALAYRALNKDVRIEKLSHDNKYNVMRGERLLAGAEVGVVITKGG